MYKIDRRGGGSKNLSRTDGPNFPVIKKNIKMILSEIKGTVSVIISNPPYKDYNA